MTLRLNATARILNPKTLTYSIHPAGATFTLLSQGYDTNPTLLIRDGPPHTLALVWAVSFANYFH